MLTISVVNGVAYGCLLYLLAAGFSMIFGVLKIVNLAHGSFFLFGAHVALSIYDAGDGLTLAVAGGAAVGAALGWICERFLLNQLQGDYLGQVLVTMGLLFILGDVAQIIWGGTPRILTPPGWLGTSIPLGSVDLSCLSPGADCRRRRGGSGSLVAGRYDDVRRPRPSGRRR